MKVRELEKILKNASPDAEVLVPGFDHSYNTTAGCDVTLAEKAGYGEYYEYIEDLSEGPTEAVVVIS